MNRLKLFTLATIHTKRYDLVDVLEIEAFLVVDDGAQIHFCCNVTRLTS